MADNILVTPGVGATVAADDISGALHQRIKLTWGVDGSAVDASASNPLPVTVANASLAVTGTFYQATQPVSGTVTANAGTGTFAISAASLPLPSGASTAAKQPALGTAGTASTDVLSVQGIASMTALKVDGSAVTQPVSGSLTTVSTVTSLSQFAGNAINLGAGAVGTGTLRITQASDSPLVAAVGAIADAAWASGSGTQISLLKTIAGAALDTTTASPVKIDQTTDGTTNAVAVKNSPAGNTAKTYTGTFLVAATALTRPANTTAYTANDSISNNATAGSVTANSVTLSDTNDHPIDIAEILLASSDTAPGAAAIQIRCHLFNSDPTASTGVVGGDNAAWSNKQAGWVGSFSGTMRAFSDGSRGVLIADEGTLRLMSPVSGAKTIYWQLQTLGAFTPSANSTTFTPTFKGFQARPA